MALRPSQIICLEYEYEALYAELIQILDEKDQIWARPIVLATLPAAFHMDYSAIKQPLAKESNAYDAGRCEPASFPAVPWLHEATLFDLRLGSDLLWPRHGFRPALDTEIIPIVTQIGEPKHNEDGNHQTNHAALQRFIHNAWNARAAR